MSGSESQFDIGLSQEEWRIFLLFGGSGLTSSNEFYRFTQGEIEVSLSWDTWNSGHCTIYGHSPKLKFTKQEIMCNSSARCDVEMAVRQYLRGHGVPDGYFSKEEFGVTLTFVNDERLFRIHFEGISGQAWSHYSMLDLSRCEWSDGFVEINITERDRLLEYARKLCYNIRSLRKVQTRK